MESQLVPSFENVLHTFRGDIFKGTCLDNKEWLLANFFEEMYSNGNIAEKTFDKFMVPKDRDMNGFIVERDFGVSQENRQRAKVLSSPQQIIERRNVLYNKQLIRYNKLQQLYDNKTKDFIMNKRCEHKLVDIMNLIRSCCNSLCSASDTVAPSHANLTS